MTGLTLAALDVGHARQRLLGPLDTHAASGRLVTLVGPNGTGKTTLLRTAAGMLPAVAGRVLIDDRDVHRLSARERASMLAVVLTDRVTTGVLDVWTAVSLGRQPHTDWTGRLSRRDEAVIGDALEACGAASLADRLVAELSDGERQRVMLARALAQEPRVLVLDEITAFLDVPRRLQVMRLLRTLAHDRGIAVVLSSHDLDLVVKLADDVWLVGADASFVSGTPADLAATGAFSRVFDPEALPAAALG